MAGLISQIASQVGISPQSCRRIAASAYLRYKVFYIPKRTPGSLRLVAQPAKEVKAIQRAIVSLLGEYLPVHECATAYTTGLSIRNNAERHMGAAYLTKLDFADFFPSIDAHTLAHHLRRHVGQISDPEVEFFLGACLWRNAGKRQLCIGAPSSPFLSNSVMFDIDSQVAALCAGHNVIYTRYSDDISLSSTAPDVLAIVERGVRSILLNAEYPRLLLNEAKRVAVGRGSAMRVTGLTLSNQGQVTVGRSRKRGVRAGVELFTRGRLDENEIEKLRGELAFVLSVEPDFRTVLIRTHGSRSLATLLPGLTDRAS